MQEKVEIKVTVGAFLFFFFFGHSGSFSFFLFFFCNSLGDRKAILLSHKVDILVLAFGSEMINVFGLTLLKITCPVCQVFLICIFNLNV